MISIIEAISQNIKTGEFSFNDYSFLSLSGLQKNSIISLNKLNREILFCSLSTRFLLNSLASLEQDLFLFYNRAFDFFQQIDSSIKNVKTLKKIHDIYFNNSSIFNYTRVYSSFNDIDSDANLKGANIEEKNAALFTKNKDGSLSPIAKSSTTEASEIWLNTNKEKVNSLLTNIVDSNGKPVKVKSISGSNDLVNETKLWNYSQGLIQPSYQFAFPTSNFKFLSLKLESSTLKNLFIQPSLLKYKGSGISLQKTIVSPTPISSISFEVPSTTIPLHEYFAFTLNVKIAGQLYQICSLSDSFSDLPELILVGPDNGLKRTVFLELDKPLTSFEASVSIEKRKDISLNLLKDILTDDFFENQILDQYWSSQINDSGIALPKEAIPETAKLFIVNYLNIGLDNLPVTLGVYTANHLELPSFIQSNSKLFSYLKLKANGITLSLSSTATSTTFKILNNKIILDSSYLNSQISYYLDYLPVETSLDKEGVLIHLPFPVRDSSKETDITIFTKNEATEKIVTFNISDMARYGNGIFYFYLPFQKLKAISSISSTITLTNKEYVVGGDNLLNVGDYSVNLTDGIFLIKADSYAIFSLKYFTSVDNSSKSISYRKIDNSLVHVPYHELNSVNFSIPKNSLTYQITDYDKNSVIPNTIHIPGFFRVSDFKLSTYNDLYLKRYSRDGDYSVFLLPFWPVNDSLSTSVLDAVTNTAVTYEIDSFYLRVLDTSNSITAVKVSYSALEDSSSIYNCFTFNEDHGLITFLQPISEQLLVTFKQHNFLVAQKTDIQLETLIENNKIKVKDASNLRSGQLLQLAYKTLKTKDHSSFLIDSDTINFIPKYIDIKTGRE